MAWVGDDGWDYPQRRRSPHLNVGHNGGSLHRTRSTGHAPFPVVNIYNDLVQDANLRSDAGYGLQPIYPIGMYPPSPEQRGRRGDGGRLSGRLGGDLLEGMAAMALQERVRSRSRGRSDLGLQERPDFLAWKLEQQEREIADEKRKTLWEREEELRRMKDDAKRRRQEDDAEAEQKRIIQNYEDKKRKDAEFAKSEEIRIREKIERDKRDAKDKEEREYQEFLAKQEAKKRKEAAEAKAEEEHVQEEMRKRLARFGYTPSQIEIMVDEEKAKKYNEEHKGRNHSRSPSAHRTTSRTDIVVRRELNRAPVYAKVHRDYLSVDTLRYFDIPYEYDRTNPDYIIIMREMDKYETEVLFEHTKRLRAGNSTLLLEAPKDRPNYAWYRKRDRSTSRVRKIGILEFKK